jgi:hypothetical protein
VRINSFTYLILFLHFFLLTLRLFQLLPFRHPRLRTLEFWVDNLNAEFLLPILSRDSDLFSELMLALTDHLRPAPYQYGLLTLRLLGKLGGKNRLFLQQPMDVPRGNETNNGGTELCIECEWNSSSKYPLALPLQRAVFVLQKLSLLEELKNGEGDFDMMKPKHSNKMPTTLRKDVRVEQIDLLEYKNELLGETIQNQASSSLVILRATLSALLCQGEEKSHEINDKSNEDDDLSFRLIRLEIAKNTNDAFLLLCKGLFHAVNVRSLRDDALLLLEGFMQHMILLVANNIEDVSRTEENLDVVKTKTENNLEERVSSRRQAVVVSGKLQPLAPFGCFTFSGELKSKSHYLVLNEVVPQILKSRSHGEVECALSIIERIVEFTKQVDEKLSKEDKYMKNVQEANANAKYLVAKLRASDVILENLLHHLCQACFSFDWQARCCVFDGICKLLELMGDQWSSTFEVELLHVALFCLKDYPHEVAIAETEALSFFFRVFSLLYGNASSDAHFAELIDEVSVPHRYDKSDLKPKDETVEKKKVHPRIPQSSVIASIMIGELGSSNSTVRYVKSLFCLQLHLSFFGVPQIILSLSYLFSMIDLQSGMYYKFFLDIAMQMIQILCRNNLPNMSQQQNVSFFLSH